MPLGTPEGGLQHSGPGDRSWRWLALTLVPSASHFKHRSVPSRRQ
jgi:hypothetical protein